jgi:hypothetical protein
MEPFRRQYDRYSEASLPAPVADDRRVDVMVRKRFPREKDIGRIIFDKDEIEL